MGVKQLNKFINEKCKKSINKKLLFDLRNKTVVVDANNYLYRFMVNDELIPNLYQFCIVLQFYNIKPIFVFDGCPPDEKKELVDAVPEANRAATSAVRPRLRAPNASS